MRRFFARTLLTLALAGAATSAPAFSLLGPLDATFMTAAIGYNPFNTDIGGPMALNQGYRWNVQTIYYGFDSSFLRFFGTNGVKAVEEALNIIGSLPAMSKLSADLHEFPTDTRRLNFRAATLGIIDLKSITLAIMMEEMGLAAPERYMWTLRDSRPITGGIQYLVIQRNFDPVTLAPSVYVNDNLFYYAIVDPIGISGGGTYADAIELPLDPLQTFTAVATAGDSVYSSQINSGTFFTGLTRDDVGGFRYLYRKGLENAYYENLVTNATPTGGGAAWTPVGGTNGVNLALRAGVDKIIFKRVKNDSTFGNFLQFTNVNKDAYFTNSHLIKQSYTRAMTLPDIIFSAGDLGLTTGGSPNMTSRSANFINGAALNTTPGVNGPTAGPGTIGPTVVITFSDIGPYLINQSPSLLDQANSGIGIVWGSFTGGTNDPVVYPVGMTIQDLERIFFAP